MDCSKDAWQELKTVTESIGPLREERVTKNSMMSNKRAIANTNKKCRDDKQTNEDDGRSSAVHGFGPGPVHQPEVIPRHQPVCPGDPHFGKNTTTAATVKTQQVQQ